MAYVRRRGNQVAIVHGERDPATKKVEQRILFTLYSKAEALEALGRRKDGDPEYFRSLIERQFPEIKFNWKKIRRAIAENMDFLPDLYEYRTARLHAQFRKDLCAIVRQLVLTDPQNLFSAARLIQEQKMELEYLAGLINWRLETCEQEKGEWNSDTPFYWRYALQSSEVPAEAEEEAAGFYESRDYDRAEVVFRLLIESFDGYAEGYNYLGLIALERGRLEDAATQFRKAVELGRRLFPKRMSRKRYWNELSTRPYMRALRNLALTLNQAGHYDEALTVCDRLDNECGDTITANSHRASVYLNTRRWCEAAESAKYLHLLSPSESLVAAFALFEQGRCEEAREFYLHGTLAYPRASQILLGERSGKPKASDEIRDHNEGITLSRALHGYLSNRSGESKRFFKQLSRNPRIAALRSEVEEVVRRRHKQHPTGEREAFKRMTEMRTPEFAREEANRLG